MQTQNIIERAFQLASSGEYGKVEDIRRVLKAERYDGVDQHISGPTIMRQLRSLLQTSRPRFSISLKQG